RVSRGRGAVHKRGGADQSYGVEVAKLAGVPNRVVDRAREILAELEAQGGAGPAVEAAPRPEDGQVSLNDMSGAAVLDELRRAAVDTITPIEALNLLYRLKQQL
ncbi:MAG: hypothetical protein K1W21_03330, partial [Oscillospiraceae bacterium]